MNRSFWRFWACVLSTLSMLSAQQPTKEYIRLGGRVIAIESSAGTGNPPVPATSLDVPPGPITVNAPDVSDQSFTVTALPANATWTLAVASGQPELELRSNPAQTGTQSVSFHWKTANTTTTDRQGTLQFTSGSISKTLTVIQRGTSTGPPLTIGPPTSASVGSCSLTGNTFSVTTSADATVAAAPASGVSWISGVTVSGTGTTRQIAYSVSANASTARSASIEVVATNPTGSTPAGFAVNQGAAPQITVPVSVPMPQAGSQDVTASVTVTAGVSFTVSITQPPTQFVTLMTAGPFTGTGSPQALQFRTASTNITTADKLATVTITASSGGCNIVKTFELRQLATSPDDAPRYVTLAPTQSPILSASAQTLTVTPSVFVNNALDPTAAWVVMKSDIEGFVTILSGTPIPGTQARCGTGTITLSVSANTDATLGSREASLSFFPIVAGTTCATTARGDTRPGTVPFVIWQLGPVAVVPTLSVTPLDFSGISHTGTPLNTYLRTDVTSNIGWDNSLFFGYSPHFSVNDWTRANGPSNFAGYINSKVMPNGTTEPLSGRLVINTYNSGGNYAQKAVFFHQNPAPPPTQVPTVSSISVSDATNSGGARGRFTLVGADLNGGSDITNARLRIAANTTTNTACEVYTQYASSYQLYLLSDSGTQLGPLTAGTPTLSNGQCTLSLANSTVGTTGSNLSATFDLQFKSALRGQTLNVYGRVKDSTNIDSDWQLRATQALTGTAPQILSVTPNVGGPSARQSFDFDVSEPFGATFLQTIDVAVRPTSEALPGCRLQYQPNINPNIVLLDNNDGGAWKSATVSASSMSLTNGLCTIRGLTNTTTVLGSRLTVDLEFAGIYGGAKVIRGQVQNNGGLASGFTDLGTWTVPETSSFNLTGPSGTVAATVGQLSTLNLNLTSFGGFNSPVALVVSGLPPNSNPIFTPNALTGTMSGTLRFTPPGGTAGNYSVAVRGTSGAIEKLVQFTLSVAGPPPLPRSLNLDGGASANTDQLTSLTRLSGLSDWRIDTALHNYTATTARATIWSIWGTVPVYVDLDPVNNLVRLISSWEGIDDARNCSVSYAGRTQMLVRVQRSSAGQYALQIWNSDGTGFAASTAGNCTGTSGTQSFTNRMAIGGDLYGIPSLSAGVAYWRLLSGLGSGALDPPSSTPVAGLLAYEFDQLTLADSGGQSPVGPTLRYSYGIGAQESLAAYVPTPAAGGGAPAFTLAANPSSVSVPKGATATSTVTITPANGFNGVVTLSASGLPAGATAGFSPATVTGSGTSTLTITAATSTPVATSGLTISGTSASLNASAGLSLNVVPPPSFSLTSGASLAVSQGGSNSTSVTVVPAGGFNAAVSFAVTGLPAGATVSFSPATVTGSGSTTMTINAAGNTPLGSASLTVTGTSGALSATVPITLAVSAAPSFSLAASPTSASATQGASATSTLTVTPAGGFAAAVSFAASGLPAGVTASFSPATVTASGNTTMTLATSGSTPVGIYNIVATGTSGAITASTTVTLNVQPAPTFTVSASPVAVTVNAASAATSSITLAPANGFTGTVTFSASNLPAGTTAGFSPATVTTSGATTVTLTTTSSTPAGAYNVTITGTSGSLTASTSVTLNVQSITLGASPTSASILQGSSTTSTITATAVGGFTNTVSFAASGLPTGATASFSPTTVTGSGTSTMTLATTGSTPAGAYPITVTATSGSLVKTTTVTLTVQAFTLSASPGTVSVSQGSSGTTSITVTPANGFANSVSFSVSGLPSGATAGFSPTTVTGSGSTTLTLSASGATTAGNYSLTITGVSGSVTRTVAVTLTVVALPSFTLSASPASVTTTQGTSVSTSIGVTPTNGFSSIVNFSVSGLPTGTTSNTLTGAYPYQTSTLTLTPGLSTAAGTYSITVTGVSGSMSRTTTVSLTVQTSPIILGGLSSGQPTVPSGALSFRYGGSSTLAWVQANATGNCLVNYDVASNTASLQYTYVNGQDQEVTGWSTLTSYSFVGNNQCSVRFDGWSMGGDGFYHLNLTVSSVLYGGGITQRAGNTVGYVTNWLYLGSWLTQ